MLSVDLKIVNPQGKKELSLLMWFGKATKATFGAFSCASGLTLIVLPWRHLLQDWGLLLGVIVTAFIQSAEQVKDLLWRCKEE